MARKGDPSAFYSLFGKQARHAYGEARAAGRDHAQATKLALAFARKIYRAFAGSRPPFSTDRWLSDQKRRFWKLKTIEAVSDHTVRREELEGFDASLQMMLQRQYCTIRRSDATLEGVLHVRRYMLLHPALRLPVYAALAGAFILAGFLYLRLSSSEISLALSSPWQQRSLIIGSKSGRFFAIRIARPPAATVVRQPLAAARPAVSAPASAREAAQRPVARPGAAPRMRASAAAALPSQRPAPHAAPPALTPPPSTAPSPALQTAAAPAVKAAADSDSLPAR